MKEQSDNKAKATTTTIKSTVEQSEPSRDELSGQELDKATGGAIDAFLEFTKEPEPTKKD